MADEVKIENDDGKKKSGKKKINFSQAIGIIANAGILPKQKNKKHGTIQQKK